MQLVATDHLRLPVAVVVLVFAIGGITTCYTFVDLLFLSTYPAAWLPYLFLGKTVFLLVFTFLVGRLVAQGARWVNAAMLYCAAFTILIAWLLLDFNLQGFPFLLALWLDVVAVMVGVIAFNAVTDVFDIREMKVVGRWITLASGVGGLVFGLAIPMLIGVLGASQLLLIIAIAFLFAATGIAALVPLPTSFREAQRSVRPLRYPLFVRTAIAFVLMLLLDTLADFTLKREVSLAYEGDAIGAFMGPFYGLANALTVILQLTTVGYLSKRFGIKGLLYAMPAFGVIAATGLILAPGLFMAAAFRMGEIVFRRAFDDLGRALVSNPLPGQVRRMARLLWNGVSAPIGIALAALALFIVPEGTGWVGLLILATSVWWIVLVRYCMKAYRTTLEEAVRVRRFSSDEDSLADNPQLVADLVQHSVNDGDDDTTVFGYELVARFDTPLPTGAAMHLKSPNTVLRMAIVKAIEARGFVTMVPELLQSIATETEAPIRWQLLKTLALIDAKAAKPFVDDLLKKPLAEDRAGAVLILLGIDDEAARQKALSALSELVHARDAEYRRGAAMVLEHLPVGEMLAALRSLLSDRSTAVLTAALQATATRKEAGLMPEVARLVSQHHIGYVAARTLVAFGEAGIPALSEAGLTGGAMGFRLAAHALARTNSLEAELALIAMNDAASVSNRTLIAIEFARYAARFKPSANFVTYARREFHRAGQELASLRHHQGEALELEVRHEMQAREQLARRRLLAWFAVLTEPSTVLEIMPQLLPRWSINFIATDRARALELLETLAEDAELKQVVSILEGSEPPSEQAATFVLEDPWLRWFIAQHENYAEGVQMQQIQVVMLLRKCSLFRDLAGEALLSIAEAGELREVSMGQAIYEDGDEADGFYVVVSGFVNLTHEGKISATLKKADTFGQFELLDDSNRLRQAVAATDGMLLFISKQTFEEITEDIPEVLRRLAHRFADDLRAVLMRGSDGMRDSQTRFVTEEDVKGEVATSSQNATFVSDAQKIFGTLQEESETTVLAPNQSVELNLDDGEVAELTLASNIFQLLVNQIISPNGQVYSLHPGENLVGRDTHCDVVVDSTMLDVSRQHLVIHCGSDGSGQMKLTNLSSSGTCVALSQVHS